MTKSKDLRAAYLDILCLQRYPVKFTRLKRLSVQSWISIENFTGRPTSSLPRGDVSQIIVENEEGMSVMLLPVFAFNSTSRYLDDLLNIDNVYFDQMVNRIYPAELQLNRANSSDTEAPFLILNLCIYNGTVSTKIYNKRDDFDIVNFPFLDGDVPRRTSYGVYISTY